MEDSKMLTDSALVIQYTLAPAVMISSAALLLVGLNNRFSSLFQRFRLLNLERRSFPSDASREAAQAGRLESVTRQLGWLHRRVQLVKNAILLIYVGILCFILTSVGLLVQKISGIDFSRAVVFIFFSGIFLIFLSVLLMIAETGLAYRILIIEKKS